MKKESLLFFKTSRFITFFKNPAHFVFAHRYGISFHVQSKETDHERSMIRGYDIHSVKLSNFKNEIAVSNIELPQLHFKESSMIEIVSSTQANTVTPINYLEGTETKKVYSQNKNFTYLDVIFDHDELFDIHELKKHNNIDPDR